MFGLRGRGFAFFVTCFATLYNCVYMLSVTFLKKRQRYGLHAIGCNRLFSLRSTNLKERDDGYFNFLRTRDWDSIGNYWMNVVATENGKLPLDLYDPSYDPSDGGGTHNAFVTNI